MSSLALNAVPVITTPLIDTGASDTSRELKARFNTELAELKQSITWNPFVSAYSELRDVFYECLQANWDGYGAQPVSVWAYEEAERFLDVLPQWIPTPNVIPEPTGEIGFEWNNGKNRVFAASVDGAGIITYAGIFGFGNKTHGTEVFSDSIPSIIIQSIDRIFSEI